MKSEEVNEILENIPNKINNWILWIVLFILFLLISLSFIIEYPDVINADVRIIAQNQPYKVISQSNGQIIFLFDPKNPVISKNETIGYIDNSANYESVQMLKKEIHNIINNDYSDSILIESKKTAIENLGEISSIYYIFSNSISQYHKEKKDSLYNLEIKFLELNQNEITEQIKVNNNIKNNIELELNILNKQLYTDSILMIEKAILPSKYDESKLNQLNIQKSYFKILADLENLKHTLNSIKFELTKKELEKNIILKELKEKIIENSQKLMSEIMYWDKLYVLTSPIAGKIEINGFIENYQFVEKNREIFKILPDKNNIRGQIFIPSVGAGVVKMGATLHIHLNDYPPNEYGYLNGKLVKISNSSSIVNGVQGYLGEVMLDNGMVTSFKVELTFVHDMQGKAEILTDEKKLIAKIFNQLKYVFNN